jgi:hypothetical protein
MLLCACLALMCESVLRKYPVWLVPDAELGKVVKQSKDVDEPNNEHDHHNAVQDSLDLTLHGKEAINQP